MRIDLSTTGQPPSLWFQKHTQEKSDHLSKTAFELESAIVKSLPVGVGGEMSRSWTTIPSTPATLTAIVGTSSSYFLAVELGRKPGKGISADGQKSVQLWAKRKLQLSPQQSKGFAYLLSEKYKREGRDSGGYIGLIQKGLPGGSTPPINPVPNSILDKAQQNLLQAFK